MSGSPPRAAQLVEFVAQRTRRARVAITGASMEPLLRAGMVVDIEPLDQPPRIGDILVFKAQQGLVAHRLIGGERFGFRPDGTLAVRPPPAGAQAFVTAGDAHPHRTERVPAGLVVGRVAAVWSGPQPGAPRVDDRRFHRRGVLLARTHALRSVVAKGRVWASLLTFDGERDASSGAFAALVAATCAFERGRHRAGVALLGSLAPADVLDMARRHRAGGLIAGWLEDAAHAGIAVPAELSEPFRRLRWINALQAGRVLRCVREVRDTLAAAGIAHVFLKGGARLAAGAPDAQRHFSGDVDVLVPAGEAEAALEALRRAGYGDVRPERERAGYRSLHHREPLSSPRGVPVEIHVALVPPALVGQRLDHAALASSLRRVSGPAGEVDILDDVTAALHLAYHARDLHVWRDIVLLSRALRVLDAADRARFDAHVRAERRDGLRLASAAAAADAIGCGQLRCRRAHKRYLAWAVWREDLPRRLAHVELIEAALGRCPRHILGLEYARRGPASSLRCWIRGLLVLPSIARLLMRRRRHPTAVTATSSCFPAL